MILDSILNSFLNVIIFVIMKWSWLLSFLSSSLLLSKLLESILIHHEACLYTKPPISYFAQNNLNNLQLLTHYFPIKLQHTPSWLSNPHPIFIPPTTSSIRIIQHLFLSPLFTLLLIHCWQIQSHQEIPHYAPILCDSSKT